MVGWGVLFDICKSDKLEIEEITVKTLRKLICLSYRMSCHDLQCWIHVLQQFLHHSKERFYKQVQSLSVTGLQQQVHSFHSNFYKSKRK